jgi:hypothetical protein
MRVPNERPLCRSNKSSLDHGSSPSPFPSSLTPHRLTGHPRDFASRFSANGGGANPTFEYGYHADDASAFCSLRIPVLWQRTDLNSTVFSTVKKCLAFATGQKNRPAGLALQTGELGQILEQGNDVPGNERILCLTANQFLSWNVATTCFGKLRSGAASVSGSLCSARRTRLGRTPLPEVLFGLTRRVRFCLTMQRAEHKSLRHSTRMIPSLAPAPGAPF